MSDIIQEETEGIGNYASLLESLQSNKDRINLAILLGDNRQFPRFRKNLESMSELETKLNNAGYNAFFLFFEDDLSPLADFDSGAHTAYNLSFDNLPELSDIDIFIVIENAEFNNFLSFPQRSKVVFYAHNLSTIYAHERNHPAMYWLCAILSDNADYCFLPGSRLKEFPQEIYEAVITDKYPEEALRGDGLLRLIPGGYFNIDYNYKQIKDQSHSENALLIAPTADWEYPNGDYLIPLINTLAARLPDSAIIIRPFPGDTVTIDRLQAQSFPENVEIDQQNSFAASAARSRLLISDPASNIKLSYACTCFKPVLEYNPATPRISLENLTGFSIRTLPALIQLTVDIMSKPDIAAEITGKLQTNISSRIANFTGAADYFIEAVEEIAAGKTRDEWVTVPKTRKFRKGLPPEQYFKIIQRNFSIHNTPYAIVYCYRMLKHALELFPGHPMLHYYLGKTANFTHAMPALTADSTPGSQYAELLRKYPETFQQINWTTDELAEVLTFFLDCDSSLSRNKLTIFFQNMLTRLASTPEGQSIISRLLQLSP